MVSGKDIILVFVVSFDVDLEEAVDMIRHRQAEILLNTHRCATLYYQAYYCQSVATRFGSLQIYHSG